MIIADLHAHPSLKTMLFGLDLSRKHRSWRFWWPLTLRTDFPKLRAGGVGLLVSSHYLPEKGILAECWLLRILFRVIPAFRKMYSGSPFDRTLELIRYFEDAVQEAAEKTGDALGVARSRLEMDRLVAEGRLAVLHAVEGAHSLDGQIANVKRLFERGVCILTLAHFFENEAVAPVNGIPPRLRPPGCFRKPRDLARGLTGFGASVVEEMLRLGMLIDLTHATPRARQQIFDLTGNKRPLLFTHTGVATLNPDPMNPGPGEIRRLAAGGGLVGVIFMNSLLSRDDRGKNGLELIVRTIREIARYGGIDCAALGTDFDGFTHPPHDCRDSGQLGRLSDRLRQSGFSNVETEKILGGNVLRVLRDGWGRPS